MPQLPFRDKGPARVIWDPDGTPLILNPTLGTTYIRLADGTSPVEEEEWGESQVDAVFTGTISSVDIPMARSTLDQLLTLLDGVTSGGPNTIYWAAKAGCDMYANAKKLQFRPLCDNVPTADTSKWITILRAYPWRDIELPFDRDSQRIHLVKFYCFTSLESGEQGRIFQYGP